MRRPRFRSGQGDGSGSLRRIVPLASALASLSLVLTSCSNATTGGGGDGSGAPGVTANKIVVGGIASLSGPLPADFAPIFQGVSAYLQMVNQAGGVDGRKIDLAYQLDDASSPSQDVDQARTLVDQYHVFAVVGVATPSFSGASFLAQHSVPTFGYAIQPQWTAGKSLFGSTGSYVNFSAPQPEVSFVASQTHAKSAAVIAYNIDQSSLACQGIAKSLKQFGFNVTFQDLSVPIPAADLHADVSQMESNHVDFVASCMDESGNILLSKTLLQSGMTGVTQYWLNGYDYSLIKQYPTLVNGTYFDLQYAPFEAASLYPGKYPGLELYLKELARYFPGQEPSEVSLQGWINAAQFVSGLKAVGRNLTQAKLIAAIDKMTSFTADGIIPPVDWTQGHSLSKTPGCVALVQAQGGKFVPVFGSGGSVFTCFSYPSPDVTVPTTIALQPGVPGG